MEPPKCELVYEAIKWRSGVDIERPFTDKIKPSAKGFSEIGVLILIDKRPTRLRIWLRLFPCLNLFYTGTGSTWECAEEGRCVSGLHHWLHERLLHAILCPGTLVSRLLASWQQYSIFTVSQWYIQPVSEELSGSTKEFTKLLQYPVLRFVSPMGVRGIYSCTGDWLLLFFGDQASSSY